MQRAKRAVAVAKPNGLPREVAGRATCTAPASMTLVTQGPGADATTTLSPRPGRIGRQLDDEMLHSTGGQDWQHVQDPHPLAIPEDVRPQSHVVIGTLAQGESFHYAVVGPWRRVFLPDRAHRSAVPLPPAATRCSPVGRAPRSLG